MKIGIMVRAIGNQTDAPGIIVLNLLDRLFEIDQANEYVLFYRHPAFFDRYQRYPRVKRLLLDSPSKMFWDQWLVPLACKKEGVDLLFHPKHSIPLAASCPTLMHLRGSDYWLHPGDYERADLIFQKLMSPVFCKKATHLIAESDYVKRDFQRIQGIPESKISRVYLAPGPDFKRIPDPGRLAEVREKYRLPQEFCLTVTRIMQGKKFYGGKNLYNMLKAFLVSNASREIKFVVVGKRTKAHVQALAGKLPNLQERVIPLDFVPQEDLPGIYNLAKFFLFPSKYESFGVPIAEAMACGCPVVTSSTTACPEIAGNAAILVDPNVLGEITDAIDCLNDHPALREVLSRKGLQRAKTFSWQRAARETLEVIHSL